MRRPNRLICATALALTLLLPPLARAGFKVWRPDVQEGAVAVETVGDAGLDTRSLQRGERGYTGEVEYGLTSWWLTEIEFEGTRAAGPDRATYFNQITSENLFAFTERGERWIDVAFFAEYGQSLQSGQPSEATLGPVLRKDLGGTSNSLNVFLTRDFGSGGVVRPSLIVNAETRIDGWTWRPAGHLIVEPGLQYYGRHGAQSSAAAWDLQDERAGPQLYGKIINIGPGTLEWNGGVLFGLNSATPRLTLRWQLEYEFH